MFVIFFFFNHLNAQNNQVTPNLQLERVRNWYLNWLGKSLLQNLKLGEEKEKKKKKNTEEKPYKENRDND